MTGNCSAFTPTHLWHSAVAEAQCVPLLYSLSRKMYNRLTPTLHVHRGNSISSTHTAGSLRNTTAGQVHQLKKLQHINHYICKLDLSKKLWVSLSWYCNLMHYNIQAANGFRDEDEITLHKNCERIHNRDLMSHWRVDWLLIGRKINLNMSVNRTHLGDLFRQNSQFECVSVMSEELQVFPTFHWQKDE